MWLELWGVHFLVLLGPCRVAIDPPEQMDVVPGANESKSDKDSAGLGVNGIHCMVSLTC